MGQKDIVEKMLEDYPDVFADIINVLIFHGEPVVKEDELHQTKTRSQYKADNSELHEQERDNLKLWISGSRIVLFGLENQTAIDHDMSLRVIGYDGASYREQLLGSPGNKRYQVMTLVLYFGDQPWRSQKRLQDRISKVEGIKGSDYKIQVFEIAFLTDEQVRMFRSDFGIIADYFVKRRRGEVYEGNRKPIRHVDAVLKFMAVFAKDQRFLKIKLDEKEEVNMCVILDRVEERGRQDGIRIGREEERARTDKILDQVEERGRQDGIRIGREEERARTDKILDQVEERGRQDGIDLVTRLIGMLLQQGRTGDIERVCADEQYCKDLLNQYRLQ